MNGDMKISFLFWSTSYQMSVSRLVGSMAGSEAVLFMLSTSRVLSFIGAVSEVVSSSDVIR